MYSARLWGSFEVGDRCSGLLWELLNHCCKNEARLLASRSIRQYVCVRFAPVCLSSGGSQRRSYIGVASTQEVLVPIIFWPPVVAFDLTYRMSSVCVLPFFSFVPSLFFVLCFHVRVCRERERANNHGVQKSVNLERGVDAGLVRSRWLCEEVCTTPVV